ncbi:hypothetical protein [Novosphingobium album (ex Liu et al. 2023)]|uniref:DUF3168 domain-containing protein n=1 Tax=Novosphingobium album (ex Liu et al. 2023) TaxID=3031130 RepID=A0ABT5WPB7_9SPHN|nr:hypothetical protein [Novosphingobium album (ex Liu et al. 2023)]MDE8651874.1 hypothetical protein [Novosphingobium album (ex Liu et al. 2023)]
MRAELLARLRSDGFVPHFAGRVASESGTRAAIDWIERKSDEKAAFPAATLQMIHTGRQYDQDGAACLQLNRVRVECFGLSCLQATSLADAIRDVLEQCATIFAVRFHRGKLLFERDFPPEDLGSGLKVYRNLRDYQVPTTPV